MRVSKIISLFIFVLLTLTALDLSQSRQTKVNYYVTSSNDILSKNNITKNEKKKKHKEFTDVPNLNVDFIYSNTFSPDGIANQLLQVKEKNIWAVLRVTRLGDLLHFGKLFRACGNNYLAQITYIFRQFLLRCKNLSFF